MRTLPARAFWLLLAALGFAGLPGCGADEVARCAKQSDCAEGALCFDGQCQTRTRTVLCEIACAPGQICQGGRCTGEPKWAPDGGERAPPREPGEPAPPMVSPRPMPPRSGGPGCSEDRQCGAPPSDICLEGRCQRGCTEFGAPPCAAGEACDVQSGHCVTAGCQTDLACGPGQVCENGRCGAACDENSCLDGERCAETGRCVIARPGLEPPFTPETNRCLNDGECVSGQICVSGGCVLGCGSAGSAPCGANERCESNGRCAPIATPVEGRAVLGAPCREDSACETGYCVMAGAEGVCSQPCGSSRQCAIGFTCFEIGAAGICLSAEALALPGGFVQRAGTLCSVSPSLCQSALCSGQICLESCSRNGDCAALGLVCQMVPLSSPEPGAATLASVCGPEQGERAGAACTAAADCQSKLCYDGRCLAPCCSQGDCGASESCDLLPLSTSLGDVRKVCLPAPSGLRLALGEICGAHGDCTSNFCLPDPSAPGAAHCVSTCCADGDCQALLGGAAHCAITDVGTPEAPFSLGACRTGARPSAPAR